MRIEENWDDCYVYSVIIKFPSRVLFSESQIMKSHRVFVFRVEMSEVEIDKIIHETFGNHVIVEHIDVWNSEPGHLLKF